MYNHIDVGQVPEFESQHVTAKLAIMYERTLEYLDLQLFAKRDRLCATNPQNPKTIAKQALVCKLALNDFVIQRWSDHNLANIKFLSA